MSGQGSGPDENLSEGNCVSCWQHSEEFNSGLREINRCFCTLDVLDICHSTTINRRKFRQIHKTTCEPFGSDMLLQLTAKQLLFNRKPTLIDNLIFRNKSAILRNQMDQRITRSTAVVQKKSSRKGKKLTSESEGDSETSSRRKSQGPPALKRLKRSIDDMSDRSTCSSVSRNGSLERVDTKDSALEPSVSRIRKVHKKGVEKVLRLSSRIHSLSLALRSGKKRDRVLALDKAGLPSKRSRLKVNGQRKVEKKINDKKEENGSVSSDRVIKRERVKDMKREETSNCKHKVKTTSTKDENKVGKTVSSSMKSASTIPTENNMAIKKVKKRKRKSDSMVWLKKTNKSKAVPSVFKETDIFKPANSIVEQDDSNKTSEISSDDTLNDAEHFTVKSENESEEVVSDANTIVNGDLTLSSEIPQNDLKSEETSDDHTEFEEAEVIKDDLVEPSKEEAVELTATVSNECAIESVDNICLTDNVLQPDLIEETMDEVSGCADKKEGFEEIVQTVPEDILSDDTSLLLNDFHDVVPASVLSEKTEEVDRDDGIDSLKDEMELEMEGTTEIPRNVTADVVEAEVISEEPKEECCETPDMVEINIGSDQVENSDEVKDILCSDSPSLLVENEQQNAEETGEVVCEVRDEEHGKINLNVISAEGYSVAELDQIPLEAFSDVLTQREPSPMAVSDEHVEVQASRTEAESQAGFEAVLPMVEVGRADSTVEDEPLKISDQSEEPERQSLKNDLLMALGLKSLKTECDVAGPSIPVTSADKPKITPTEPVYTGTLKAVIKLNRGADKKSRSMVFKGASSEDGNQLHYEICSPGGNAPATGVPITHLAEITGSKKPKEKIVTDFDTVSNSQYVATHLPSDEDDKLGSKESNLVIPEKSSSFSIHPERLCSDVCCYCFGKFGSLDTPCHIAQLKGEERQQKILKNEPYLTVESCLCDACYRYVDRKANCPTQQSRKKSRPPVAAICCVTDCSEQATHSVKRKWLLKIRRSITHKFDIDMEKHNAVYNPLCSNHHYWVDYYMVCGICRKRLNRNHLFTLGNETDRLNLVLAEDGIPARLSDKLFLCKLCRYYTNMRLKYSDPSTIPSSSQPFYKNYRKKILGSLDVEVSESEGEGEEDSGDKLRVKTEVKSAEEEVAAAEVMSLSGLANLLSDQPEQQPRIQVKFGNVNIGTLSNLNIGQGGGGGVGGRAEERPRGESPLPLSANFDFQGPSTSDGSWEKVTSTLQFDKKTKQLWQELQRPYGNQSSFLRHLVMLEKFWRAGNLVLSEKADVRAAKYINSIQTRIKSLEGKADRPAAMPVLNPIPVSAPTTTAPSPVPVSTSRSATVVVPVSVSTSAPAVVQPLQVPTQLRYEEARQDMKTGFYPIITTGEVEVTPVNPKSSAMKEIPQSKGTMIIQRPVTPHHHNKCRLTITSVSSLARPRPDQTLLNRAKSLVRMVSPPALRQRGPSPVPIQRVARTPHMFSALPYLQAHLAAPIQGPHPLQKLQQVVYQPRLNGVPPPLVKIAETPPPPPYRAVVRAQVPISLPPPLPPPPPPPPPMAMPLPPPSLPGVLGSLAATQSITIPSAGITIEKRPHNFHPPQVLPPEKPIVSVYREPVPTSQAPL